MARVHKPGDLTKWVNLSPAVNKANAKYTLTETLGLFMPMPLEGKFVAIPRITQRDNLLEDIQWGARAQTIEGDTKAYLSLMVPRFPTTDSILPTDIGNNYRWEDVIEGEQPETLVAVRDRKMSKHRQAFMDTWEKARMQLIIDGTVYAPNGTVVTNFYTEFGETRDDVAMSLNDETVDVQSEVEEIIASIQDNIKNGSVPGRFMAICGSTFFAALVKHPYVKEAAKWVEFGGQREDVLVGRLGNNLGLDARYRALDFGGIYWVQDRKFMTAAEARVFPLDVPEMFITYFAPHELTFGVQGQAAQQIYYFEKLIDDLPQEIKIHVESNFMNACMYPQAIVRVTIAA